MKRQEMTFEDSQMGLIQYAAPNSKSKSGKIEVRLKNLLERKDVSMLAVSRASGVNYESLRGLASGRAKLVSFNVLERLCITLNCEISDLLKLTRK